MHLNQCKMTYSMRDLNVLDKHRHFLLGDKTLEVLPWEFLAERRELRLDTIPKDALGQRKEVSHECTLAGKFNLDGTVTETTETAVGKVELMSFYSLHCVVKSGELDIAVHGFGSDTTHDDVNGLVLIIKDE